MTGGDENSRPASPGTLRVRLHRERRREGLRLLTLPASKSAGEVEELPHNPLDFIVLALAGVLEDNLAALVDNVLRRPILVSIGVPRGVLIVLRDRIADAMAL